MSIKAIALGLVIAVAECAFIATAQASLVPAASEGAAPTIVAVEDSSAFVIALPEGADAFLATELPAFALNTSDWEPFFNMELAEGTDRVVPSGPWPLPPAFSLDAPFAPVEVFEPRFVSLFGTALVAAALGVLTHQGIPRRRRSRIRQRGNGQSARLHAVAFPVGT